MGTTSNHHAPYDLGYTRNTMAVNNEEQTREGEQNLKNGLSSDCRLQLACMKLELLVIADHRLHEVGIASNRGSACHGEYVPGPCTHRPSHHESWEHPKSVV